MNDPLTIAKMAKKVIIEYSSLLPDILPGIPRQLPPSTPPHRREIPPKAEQTIGSPVLKIDPAKIIGVVPSNESESISSFTRLNDVTHAIGLNVSEFLAYELKNGRMPADFLPIKAESATSLTPPSTVWPRIPTSHGLKCSPKWCRTPSWTSCSREMQLRLHLRTRLLRRHHATVYGRHRLLSRKAADASSEISNHPEVVRRLGLIAMNTALECDIYGFVNSTHINGTYMMNGIGGSGDFCRNAWYSIFLCPSTQKGEGYLRSSPMVTHVDHSDHDVKVIVTEQGVADLRGKARDKEH